MTLFHSVYHRAGDGEARSATGAFRGTLLASPACPTSASLFTAGPASVSTGRESRSRHPIPRFRGTRGVRRHHLGDCPRGEGICDQLVPAPAPVMWAMTASNSLVGEKST